jgi:UDP-N-acetylglucosamine 4-epimerase
MSNMEISGKRVLITGGAGFIGSHLSEKLVAEGAEVIVVDNLATGRLSNISHLLGSSRIKFIEGDIRNRDLCLDVMKGVEVVLHQAALGSVPRSIADPQNTHSVNIDGFLNVLDSARIQGVKKFVYASSSSVYGDDPSVPKKEDKTGNLLSPYAVTKHTNEQYARVYAQLYDMNIIGLRYFNVFGPNQSPEGQYAAVIPLFINGMLNGKAPVIFGDGGTTRDFTFVSNVVNANLAAMMIDKLPADVLPVFNIAFGGTTSLNELFRIIADKVGFTGSPVYQPERKGDIRQSFANIDAAQKYLNYQPSTDLEKGLELTISSFRR